MPWQYRTLTDIFSFLNSVSLGLLKSASLLVLLLALKLFFPSVFVGLFSWFYIWLFQGLHLWSSPFWSYIVNLRKSVTNVFSAIWIAPESVISRWTLLSSKLLGTSSEILADVSKSPCSSWDSFSSPQFHLFFLLHTLPLFLGSSCHYIAVWKSLYGPYLPALNLCCQEIISEFLLWVRHCASCLRYMENQIDPYKVHSLVAGIDIHLIYPTNIALQTEISAVEEKPNVLWEHVMKGPNFSWDLHGFL